MGAAWDLLGPVGLVEPLSVAGAAGLAGAVTGAGWLAWSSGAVFTAFLTERIGLSTEQGWLAWGCPCSLAGALAGGPVAIGLDPSRGCGPASSCADRAAVALAAIDSSLAASSTFAALQAQVPGQLIKF